MTEEFILIQTFADIEENRIKLNYVISGKYKGSLFYEGINSDYKEKMSLNVTLGKNGRRYILNAQSIRSKLETDFKPTHNFGEIYDLIEFLKSNIKPKAAQFLERAVQEAKSSREE